MLLWPDLRHVRYHAKEWKCDPKRVGVMGISAGGHVAATAATSFDDGNPKSDDPVERMSCRPDFAILLCPVITMGTNTHAWSRENLLGRNPTPKMMQRYSAETRVTENTCPCFLAHAQDDRDVPPGNSQAFYEALLAWRPLRMRSGVRFKRRSERGWIEGIGRFE